jgi:hypothetical protein
MRYGNIPVTFLFFTAVFKHHTNTHNKEQDMAQEIIPSSGRKTLYAMEKDTILFVRSTGCALAYHIDYFENNSDHISKEFLYDPAITVWYKAGDTYDSWVLYEHAIEDGMYIGVYTVQDACRIAYAEGNRLVRDLNVSIPEARYTDANGYVYQIPIGDGEGSFAREISLQSGGLETDDIKLSQFSVVNPSLTFEQRHLMDDLKLEYKNPEDRNNALITYNSLITPIIKDMNDESVAYIRNALRTTSYNLTDIIEGEGALPLSPHITENPITMLLPQTAHTDPNLFFAAHGKLFRISPDNTFWKSDSFYNPTTFEEFFPPLLLTPRTEFDIRTSAELVAEYPVGRTYIVPIPQVDGGLFAFIPTIHECASPESYRQYALSYDNGLSWNRYFFDAIDPAIVEEIQGIVYIPYKPLPHLLVVGILLRDRALYYTSDNGINWTMFDPNINPLLPLDLFRSKHELEAYTQKYYTDPYIEDDDLVSSTYTAHTGHLMVKRNNLWMPYTQYMDELMALVTAAIEEGLIDYSPDVQKRFTFCYHYSDVLQVIYCAECAYNDSNGDLTIKNKNGVIYITAGVSPQEPLVIKQHIVSTASLEEIMTQTKQYSKNLTHGAYTVYFDKLYRINGKWIIRDRLGCHCEEFRTPCSFDNRDSEEGYNFRISEDAIHWFPVRGIQGESYSEKTAILYNHAAMLLFFIDNAKAYSYKFPNKKRFHYDIRLTAHKWEGVGLSSHIESIYVKDAANVARHSSPTPPLKIGFPVAINPHAFILLYNGLPIFEGRTYVNPENHKEIIVNNLEREKILQEYINPIQFHIAGRAYVYNDFSVITAYSQDPTKECYLYFDKARIHYIGKECYAEFDSDIHSSCILFNGLAHEYIIVNKRTIKYIVSRFGLREIEEAESPFVTINRHHNDETPPPNVYKLQFLLL